MEYRITKSYLVFPTSRNAVVKKLIFRKDGECVYDLDIALDYVTPESECYVDVKRFGGETLDISVCPWMELTIKQKDSMPNCKFSERLRPKYHFTAPEGWMNDPNGLVYQNGLYHMFYQLNPVSVNWGNMHWGHAVSTNLVDWEYRSCALFPDRNGTMFSGSAIIDERNRLGMKSDSERKAMVLFYTAAGDKSEASRGQPFTQCMAVSTDGGVTFAKLPSNPFIPHIEAENRDPKVVYSERLGLYVMSLYLEQDRYLIFTSKNLLDWERIQEIRLPNDAECPAFFPLEYGKEEKWVLMGASDRYIVGSFDGKSFTADHDSSLMLTYSGENTYAAQRFESIPGGECVRFAWMKTNFAPYGMPFNGAMTVPQRLALRETPEGARLTVYPSSEFDKLRGRKNKQRVTCTDFSDELSGIARDVVLSIDQKDASFANISLFGRSYKIDFMSMTFEGKDCIAPLVRDENGRINIRMLTDVCGIEIYLSTGLAYMADITIPDMNLSSFVLSSDSEIDLKYESYKLRDTRKNDKRR